MKTNKFDGFLVWILFMVAVIVALVLVLISVKPVGAKSVCGPLVGPAAVVDDALVLAGVPHVVLERHTAPIATCLMVGCPKPKPPKCLGWTMRISAAGTSYTTKKVYVPDRYIELQFNAAGIFYGGVR